MSDDEPAEQPPAFIRAAGRLTRRERALVVVTGTIALVAGLWIGLWLVPDAALDVPKNYHERPSGGYWNAAYKPVPGIAVPVTIILLGLGAWGTWRQVASDVVEGSA